MNFYADSSFILRLVLEEPGSQNAVGEYRRLGRPSIIYLPLHALEVENAIRQRALHERQSLPAHRRQHISRQRDAALSRLAQYLNRRALTSMSLDMEAALERAREISLRHTERTGARAIDLLHVACALLLNSNTFLTFDKRQAELAKAEGLEVAELQST